MPDNADLVRGWLRKMLEDQDGPYDAARFRAQQAVEKYLKGLLAHRSQPIVQTHNLEELEQVCTQQLSSWPLETVDVPTLAAVVTLLVRSKRERADRGPGA
ncbi:MAG: HEPN domain-containing protein, partial [Candidatus Latescibacterota bacterium]|nr:HEPN domain-containing protein [Candidatus Latescibacterota bacterium]